MKHFILVFTAIMFLANTYAVSAWAKPCASMNPVSSVSQMAAAEMPPCHEQQDEQKTNKHCKGLCLCFHAAINQTPTLNEAVQFIPPSIKADRELKQNDVVAVWATYPPRRPPKA